VNADPTVLPSRRELLELRRVAVAHGLSVPGVARGIREEVASASPKAPEGHQLDRPRLARISS
jgi:hypothetical protein